MATHCNKEPHFCRALLHTEIGLFCIRDLAISGGYLSLPPHSKTSGYDCKTCNTLQHTATHCNTLQHTATRCNTLQSVREAASYVIKIFGANAKRLGTKGWRRYIGYLKSQVTFRKRAPNYRALLRKMNYKHKASRGSSPPCNNMWGSDQRFKVNQIWSKWTWEVFSSQFLPSSFPSVEFLKFALIKFAF